MQNGAHHLYRQVDFRAGQLGRQQRHVDVVMRIDPDRFRDDPFDPGVAFPVVQDQSGFNIMTAPAPVTVRINWRRDQAGGNFSITIKFKCFVNDKEKKPARAEGDA